jgi:hypothetical protein
VGTEVHRVCSQARGVCYTDLPAGRQGYTEWAQRFTEFGRKLAEFVTLSTTEEHGGAQSLLASSRNLLHGGTQRRHGGALSKFRDLLYRVSYLYIIPILTPRDSVLNSAKLRVPKK